MAKEDLFYFTCLFKFRPFNNIGIWYWSKNTKKLKTENAVNVIQKSLILQLSVAKNRIRLSTFQPIFVRLCPKNTFLRQKSCALWWRTVKKR